MTTPITDPAKPLGVDRPVCPADQAYYYTGTECVPLDHEACLEGTGAISMLPCGPGALPATGGVDIPAPAFGFGLVAVGLVLLRISRRRWTP